MSLFDYKIKFTKDWTNPADFPAYEADESKVRADMQYLFNEIKQGFNNFIDNLKASLLPFTPTSAITSSDVQSAIEEVQGQIAGQALGQIPDDSLENAKLVDKTVENTKIKDGTVITSLIADGAVGATKIEDGAITTAKIATGAVTAEKLDSHALDGKADLVNGKIAAAQLTRATNASVLKDKVAYTLAVSDANSVLYCVNTLDATVAIPLNSVAALPVGTVIEFIQGEKGKVTLAPATGVTLTGFASALSTTGVGSKLVLIKLNTNAWQVSQIGVPADGTIGVSQIADDAVTTDKIADNAVSFQTTLDIPSTEWTMWNELVYKDVSGVKGLLSTDRVVMDLYTADDALYTDVYKLIALEAELSNIIKATVIADGTIRFVSKSVPAQTIPVKLQCFRR